MLVYFVPQLESAKNLIESSLFFWDDSLRDKHDVGGSSMSMRINQTLYPWVMISDNILFGHGFGFTAENFNTFGLHPVMANFETILAFEPHPVVNKVLSLNKEINGFDNINIQPYGLSNIDAEVTLYEPIRNAGGSSLEHTGSGMSYTVKIKHASTIINQLKHDNNVSFIKMDVEGHELKVMQGLKETLINDKPVVAFEANDLERNESLLEYMKSIGYNRFLALDTSPSLKSPILRVLLLCIFGARYQLKPIQHLNNQKYSLVFAFHDN